MSTLITNAFIVTADAAWRTYAHGALLVDDGKIRWIGDAADAPTAPADPEAAPPTVIDAGGQVVIPGLINAHAHGGLSIHRGVCDDGDLFSWAANLSPHTSHLDAQDIEIGCHLAILEQVASGTTCTCDCTRYETSTFARVASRIGLRSLSGALVNSPELRPQGRPNWPSALHETEHALDEFRDNPLVRFFLGAHSPYNCTPDLLREIKRHSERLGIPFNIHVAETRAEVERIQAKYGERPLAWLDSLGILDETVLIDHAVWLLEDELEIAAKRGVAVAHCPVSNAKLGSGIAPVPAMLQAGIPVGLGTDSVLSQNSQDLFEEMKFAVLLQRASRVDGFLLSARDALAMATRLSARAIGWADQIGSLEVGKQADLVFLDLTHPLGLTPARVESDLVFAAKTKSVRAVMVAGKIIYEDGHFTQVDVDELWDSIRRRYQPA